MASDPKNSSSSSSSSEGEEEEPVVLKDTDRISMSKAFPRPSDASPLDPAAVEEDKGDRYADPQSPGGSSNSGDAGNAQQSASEVSVSEGESSSSDGVLVERPTNPDQDSRCLQVDPDSGILVNIDGSTQEGDREVEDSGKEDNFVDAPDQLGFSESRSSSGLGESMAVIDIAQRSREKVLEDRVAQLSAQLERTSNECRKYKEEMGVCRGEIVGLQQMLQTTVEDQFGPSGNNKIKVEEDPEYVISSTPLSLMVRDCSKFASYLRSNIVKQSQLEGHHPDAKEREIEELNMKLSRNSLYQDVSLSYWTSLRGLWLESSKQATDCTAERLLASLRTVVPLDDKLLEDSLVDKTSLVEKGTSMLIEKYSHIMTEIERLGQYLAALRSDFVMPQQSELGSVFDTLRKEILEGKNKEIFFSETINELKKEKDQLLGQLDQSQHDLEEVKAEASKAKAELEQAENKLVAVKEKLSMAVTKGKSLVQHRDSLKQSLTEKTSALEKCLLELQQKSDALQSNKADIKELNKCQCLVVSLQDSLSQQNKIIQEIEDAVSQVDCPTGSHPVEVVDAVRWLVAQKQASEGVLLENRKLKDALSSFSLPESISSSDLEYQVHYLFESVTQYKDDITRLEDELASSRAAVLSCESQLVEAHKEFDMLTLSVFKGKQEITSLHAAHEELMYKYEEVVEKLSQISLEKNQVMKALLEISESPTDYQPPSGLDKVIEECLGRVKSWKNTVLESSRNEFEQFQRLQALLYMRNQDLMLSENILEEEMLDRVVFMNLSHELMQARDEVKALRKERDSLQKNFDHIEEKCSMLREKLSMAVKKGKGLVQEREGFKVSLDEKDSEIQKLKNDLQLQESVIVEHREQIKKLTTKVEHLQYNIVSLQEERDQIKQNLKDNSNSLQSVTDAIDCIPLPISITSEGPVEKLKKIADYMEDIKIFKSSAEEALENARVEAVANSTKLLDAYASIRSLEDSLSQMERKSVTTIEEKDEANHERLFMEQELRKVKEELGSLTVELKQSQATAKNLQNSLMQAENRFSVLMNEKNEFESRCAQEIITLNTKLAVCMEELSGTRGSLENQSSELVSHLQHLQMLTRDKSLLTLIVEEFKRKANGLKSLALLIQNVHDKFAVIGTHSEPEQDAHLRQFFSLPQFEEYADGDGNILSIDSRTLDADANILSFSDVAEAAGNQMKQTAESFKEFSAYIDENITLLLQAFQAMQRKVDGILEQRERLMVNVNKLEADNLAQELRVIKLQNDMSILLSACRSSIQDLQINFNDILDMELFSEYKRDDSTALLVSRENDDDVFMKEGENMDNADEYHVTATAAKLSAAARRIKSKTQQLSSVKGMWIVAINDLKRKSREAELAVETAIQGQNTKHEMVLKLEADVEELQSSLKDMKHKMKDYHAIEVVLREKDAEISLLHQMLAEKETEEDKKQFLEGQLEQLFAKTAAIEIPFGELDMDVAGSNFQNPMDKLFYVVDNVLKLRYMIKSMACVKEDMQLVMSNNLQELEQLRKDNENYVSINQDLENRKHDSIELSAGLEKVIQKLAGYDYLETKKPIDVKGLFHVLERLVVGSIQDSESLKLRVQELTATLQASRMLNDELSSKLKLLESSIYARPPLPDVKERSISEASSPVTGPEISEVEDGGSAGKRSVAPVPVATLVRASRKGSSDHLALSIDPESEPLTSPHEIDDKGHVFKSLNTSGLIPKQGKHIADRIDGIWVSGGRILMSRPGARISLIAYWLLLHLWVLGTIL